MTSVCVFCGSSRGKRPEFEAAAREFGTLLAQTGRKLVYGGGNVGLMGILADAVLAGGGTVIGVIPQTLVEKEVAHARLTKLHVVHSMHERKALMAELADGFVALPGGIGTMEEFFEVWTWGQLGLHRKPYGILNVAGFYDPLLAFLKEMLADGFIRQKHLDAVVVDNQPELLLAQMSAHVPPTAAKWIDRSET